ncbi:hypothetical protein RRG08_024650 [Elysia crispata]|uniref:Uncharacterized protein n=1 Tax=Elysia crispata TaxID=231223 RepID=A0AAE0ZYC0_9GAST|nr:hypothetical protein RRG08_024650 [Elysia crispata]
MRPRRNSMIQLFKLVITLFQVFCTQFESNLCSNGKPWLLDKEIMKHERTKMRLSLASLMDRSKQPRSTVSLISRSVIKLLFVPTSPATQICKVDRTDPVHVVQKIGKIRPVTFSFRPGRLTIATYRIRGDYSGATPESISPRVEIIGGGAGPSWQGRAARLGSARLGSARLGLGWVGLKISFITRRESYDFMALTDESCNNNLLTADGSRSEPWGIRADVLSPQPSDDGHAVVTDVDLPNLGVSGRTLYLHSHRMMDMPWLLTWIYRTLGYQGGRFISTAIG